MPEVTYAVILTRGAERADVALRSIAAQGVDSEVLLVLNDADDPMRRLAEAWVARGARVVHDGADLGVMLGYNVALREARSRFFSTVHEDSNVAPGCIERLIATMDEHAEAGAVGPSVDTPALTGGDFNIVWRDAAATHVSASHPDPVIATDYAGSNCLLLRRDVLAELGGFDVDFFPAIYGDADVGVRLWRAGWASLCDRRARNAHRTGAMVDQARGPRHGPQHRHFLLERNRARFAAKHADWLAGQPDRANREDARHPAEQEVAEAVARAMARWQALAHPPPRPAPGSSKVALPDRLEATVAELRRKIGEEFLAHLVERNGALEAENARLHEAYAKLHGEHVVLDRRLAGMYQAYVEPRTEADRLNSSGGPHRSTE